MPKSKLDETLKKIVASTTKASTPTSSSISSLGDPDCPFCHGAGYLRQDLPLDHPNFGKLEICSCRHKVIAQQVRQRLFSLSHLEDLKELTFETFLPRGRTGLGELHSNSLEAGYNRAHQYAGNLQGWLLITGRTGCGKTHLAAAIANFAVSMGVPTLFLTVPDLLDLLRFAYDSENTTFEGRFEQIRTASLLVLDDFGTQNATEWAQEKLFQIINYRYINHLPLVVTTNLAVSQIEPRIRSRLQDPEMVSLVRIQAPDYRRLADDTGNPELSSLDLLAGKTFGNLTDRSDEGLDPAYVKSLEKAIKAAHAFAEDPHGWLVFLGPYGCGKTHLAAAIANYRAGLGDPPLLIFMTDLLDHLRATFNQSSPVTYDRRFEEIRTAHLLILDDMSTHAVSPWAREKLHQLLNYRYYAELPTVITSVERMEQMDERIASRLLDMRLCSIHMIDVPSYHGSGRNRRSGKN